MFRYILTGLFILSILGQAVIIDKERESITASGWAINSMINAAIIYGLWHWM